MFQLFNLKITKRILILLLAIGLLSFTNFNQESIINNTKTEIAACKYGQCTAIAKSTKKQCKHCVSNEGDLYCWQHK